MSERNKRTVMDGSDGIDGSEEFLASLRRDFPELRAEVKRLFADGDHVVAHVYGVRVPGQPGTATVDIFRLDQDGRIVEHSDVMQAIPDAAANANGVF